MTNSNKFIVEYIFEELLFMKECIEIPKHVAIIMDGNGRWAVKRGLKRSAGHLEGSKAFERMVTHAFRRGVEVVSVYAFSTDNFKRSEEEVKYLMNLFITFFQKKMKKVMDNGIRVVFSGRKVNLRDDVVAAMDKIIRQSAGGKKGTLNICLNYGGQEEIVDALVKVVQEVQSEKLSLDTFDKSDLYRYLYVDLPPIDLLIRTSGEERISNFMLYQAAYAEFYFTDVLFPDFTEENLDEAIEEFNNRHRRFGSA